MNMDVLNQLTVDHAIDLGLYLIAFLASGLFWRLALGRRTEPAPVAETVAEPRSPAPSITLQRGPEEAETTTSPSKAPGTFVSLTESSAGVRRSESAPRSERTTPRLSPRDRGARLAAIERARAMLAEGQSVSTIRASVGLSDGELALLQMAQAQAAR